MPKIYRVLALSIIIIVGIYFYAVLVYKEPFDSKSNNINSAEAFDGKNPLVLNNEANESKLREMTIYFLSLDHTKYLPQNLGELANSCKTTPFKCNDGEVFRLTTYMVLPNMIETNFVVSDMKEMIKMCPDPYIAEIRMFDYRHRYLLCKKDKMNSVLSVYEAVSEWRNIYRQIK